ncbi:MAG: hypothetical protein IPG71_00315 [bacterium]|nr:hypothetical protein [bacterium]
MIPALNGSFNIPVWVNAVRKIIDSNTIGTVIIPTKFQIDFVVQDSAQIGCGRAGNCIALMDERFESIVHNIFNYRRRVVRQFPSSNQQQTAPRQLAVRFQSPFITGTCL